MKKLTTTLVLPLLLGIAYAAPTENATKKDAPTEFVVIEIENTGFYAGKVFLSRQFGAPHYIGRVGPAQTTRIKIPAPIADDYHTFFVTKAGRVTDTAIIEGEIRPGDKIAWDLSNDMIVWESKKSDAKSK